jgi:oligosaccharide repeat unit polymerase
MIFSVALCFCAIIFIYLWWWKKAEANLCHPFFWITTVFVVLFPVRAVIISVSGSELIEWSIYRNVVDTDLSNGLLVALLGLVFLFIGFISFGLTKGVKRDQIERVASMGLQPINFQSVSLIHFIFLYLIGVSLRLVLIILAYGSAEAFFVADKDEMMRSASGEIYINIVISSLTAVPLFALIIYGRNRKAYGLSGIFFILELMFALLSGSRSGLAFLLASTLLAYYLRCPSSPERARKYLLSFVFIGLIGVVSFGPLSHVRFYGLEGIYDKIYAEDLDVNTIFTPIAQRLVGLDALVIVMDKCPAEIPHTFFGEEAVALASAPIPRIIWEGKPIISVGKKFSSLFLNGYYGPGASAAATIWGHAWWVGGFFSVVTISLILGFAIGFVWNLSVSWPAFRPLCAMMIPSWIVIIEQDIIAVLTIHATILFFSSLILSFFVYGRARIGGLK